MTERISAEEARCLLRDAEAHIEDCEISAARRPGTDADWPAVARLAREAPALAATVEALEAERDEARDCGQDGVCTLSPGCQRHFLERNAELVMDRDEARAELARLRDRAAATRGQR